jgi:hypothetical protein
MAVSDKDHRLVTPYSEENMRMCFEWQPIVIIPVMPNKPAKSANRLIRAVQAGCFVVAEPHPSHEEFKDLVWIGNIYEGVIWAWENEREAMEKVVKAQDYINENYSMNRIGELWKKAISQALEQK